MGQQMTTGRPSKSQGEGQAAGDGDEDGVREGIPPPPHSAIIAVAEVTTATAAAADLSWPPVTAAGDALRATLTRERAGVFEAAAVDGSTTAALLFVLAAAVAGGASPAVPAAGDCLAALTAVASAVGTYAGANPSVACLRPQLAIATGSPLDWLHSHTVRLGLWQAIWGVTLALFIFLAFRTGCSQSVVMHTYT